MAELEIDAELRPWPERCVPRAFDLIACRAMPWLPISLNVADMLKCNAITVHRHPRHGQ